MLLELDLVAWIIIDVVLGSRVAYWGCPVNGIIRRAKRHGSIAGDRENAGDRFLANTF
jgi:hypothetical protein